MREIKFRVFEPNAWFPGYKPKIEQVDLISWDSNGNIESILTNGGAQIEGEYLKSATLMMYTGLKDKNGKEIYISDFIRFDNGDTGVVRLEDWLEIYIEQLGEWECEDQIRDLYRIERSEVIGNIYENPELIS